MTMSTEMGNEKRSNICAIFSCGTPCLFLLEREEKKLQLEIVTDCRNRKNLRESQRESKTLPPSGRLRQRLFSTPQIYKIPVCGQNAYKHIQLCNTLYSMHPSITSNHIHKIASSNISQKGSLVKINIFFCQQS